VSQQAKVIIAASLELLQLATPSALHGKTKKKKKKATLGIAANGKL
jgi:hypothetical protein